MTDSKRLLAFYGHHKCASTWIHTVLDAVAADAGWRMAYLYDPKLFDGDLPRYVAANRIDFVSYVNADYRYTKDLPEHRGFHVVRDPRDLVVSAYFSHLHSHPTENWEELIPHRERLQGVSKDEGLALEIEFSSQFLDHMAGWSYDQPHVLELKQEEFTNDPYRGFLSVFDFLGVLDDAHYNKKRWIPYLLRSTTNILNRRSGGAWPLRAPMASVPGERLLGVVYDHRFEKLAGGRGKGKPDEKSHYRKGVGGDWVNHFTDEHVALFKERYGDLVLELGYESSPDWSAGPNRRAAAPA